LSRCTRISRAACGPLPRLTCSSSMTRYFFDIREGNKFAPDEEGIELPHVEAAQIEAARSLADLVRDKIDSQPFTFMSIQVRDSDGPIVEAKFVWELLHSRT
jgi:hypothetical protein